MRISRSMKLIMVGALLMAILSLVFAEPFQALLEFLVFMAATTVGLQAFRRREYLWAVGFATIAGIFNPAFPLFASANTMFRVVTLLCFTIMVLSLAGSKTLPRLSARSMLSSSGRRESL